jgi:hypothetical protein
MSGWTVNLLTGMAQYLAAGGAGTWDPPGGVFTAGQTGIVLRDIPATPDRLITLAPYPVASVPGLADVTQGVQLRVRGTEDPRVCEDIGDACYELLHGLSHLATGAPVWGGISIVQVYRQSALSLGQDGNSRWEASHNYYVEAMRPNINNPD